MGRYNRTDTRAGNPSNALRDLSPDEFHMGWRTTLLPLACCLIMVLMSGCGSSSPEPGGGNTPSPSVNSPSTAKNSGNATTGIPAHLLDEIRKVNARCPVKVDFLTTLVSVKATPPKRIVYTYEVAVPQLTAQQKTNIKTAVVGQAKTNPQLKPLFDVGVTLVYRYKNATGTVLLEFPVTG